MSKTKLRLKKVNGQVSGIIKMIDEKQDCQDIIIQIQAVRAAINSTYSEYLNDNLKQCIKEKKDIDKIIKLITKK